MNLLIRYFLYIICATLPFHTHAMTLQKQGSQLFATGALGGDDWLKFSQALADPALDTVVLVNSPGGNLWDGLTISKLIAEKRLNTVVAGGCSSACAIVFMGGKERRFSNAFAPELTYIGIHGAHSLDTGAVQAQASPEVYALFKTAMGDKFNADIINTALYKMGDRHAMLVVPDSIRRPLALAFHCNDGQTPWANCMQYKDANAFSLGVITHTDLVTLNVPTAFQPPTELLGRAVTTPLAEPAAYLKTAAGQHCISERCKNDVLDLRALDNSKALAVRAGPGMEWSSGQASILQAVLVAVYGCNHMPERPVALCSAEMANGFDLRHFDAEAEAGHRAAFAKLQVPTAKFYASEEYGGGFGSATAYRFQHFMDVPPMQIEGVQTIGTQALARMLKSDTPPAVVDIGGTDETIPTASTLFFGGNAFDNPALDAKFDSQFTALLKLLAPHVDRPLVILGTGRNWLSANAALGAKRAGYAQVMWYRGGMEAWKSANLPSASTTVHAVAN